jgi:hypothetical protein
MPAMRARRKAETLKARWAPRRARDTSHRREFPIATSTARDYIELIFLGSPADQPWGEKSMYPDIGPWRPAALARGGKTALLALTLSLGAAAPLSCALAQDFVGTVFTMTNSAVGVNQIVAYGRQGDGSLALLYVVPTGGLGSGPAPTSTVFGAPVPATADGLGSQGSLILSPDRRFLFAVNAGSDSISCLRVGTNDLRARTASSGGVFPVSLTFRADGSGGVLYVLNAGGRGNITGFRVG